MLFTAIFVSSNTAHRAGWYGSFLMLSRSSIWFFHFQAFSHGLCFSVISFWSRFWVYTPIETVRLYSILERNKRSSNWPLPSGHARPFRSPYLRPPCKLLCWWWIKMSIYSFDDTAAPHTTTRIPSLPVHGFWPSKIVFCSLGNLIVQCQYIPGPNFSVIPSTVLFLYGWSSHWCTMIVDFLPLMWNTILIIWGIWMNDWMGVFYCSDINLGYSFFSMKVKTVTLALLSCTAFSCLSNQLMLEKDGFLSPTHSHILVHPQRIIHLKRQTPQYQPEPVPRKHNKRNKPQICATFNAW